jgi:hypothetical protein
MSDRAGDPPRNEDLVFTPGGPRPSGHVQLVCPGEALRLDEGGKISIISQPPPPIYERSSAVQDTFVLTPGGYRPPTLVHRVEPNQALHVTHAKARLMDLATKELTDVPEAAVQPGDFHAFGSGWITFSSWLNKTSSPLSYFRTTWRVPPAPTTQSDQAIFLFNGMSPSNYLSAILQPVLQWGRTAPGGGAHWSVASWYVLGSGRAFHSALIPVNVGDILTGVMTLTEQADGMFSYNSEFQGLAGTSLTVLDVEELVWCTETLEAYSISHCSDYPDADFVAMEAIKIRTGEAIPTLSWTPVNEVTDCGQHSRVKSDSATDGEVNIYFRTLTG